MHTCCMLHDNHSPPTARTEAADGHQRGVHGITTTLYLMRCSLPTRLQGHAVPARGVQGADQAVCGAGEAKGRLWRLVPPGHPLRTRLAGGGCQGVRERARWWGGVVGWLTLRTGCGDWAARGPAPAASDRIVGSQHLQLSQCVQLLTQASPFLLSVWSPAASSPRAATKPPTS